MAEINWKARINVLRRAGYSLRDIATATGMARSSVGDLATGRSKCPSWRYGIALDALYEAVRPGKRAG